VQRVSYINQMPLLQPPEPICVIYTLQNRTF
jgi:hypothetical protein